jgi:hypothetical protein
MSGVLQAFSLVAVARDPRTISPSEWRSNMPNIRSRHDYIEALIGRRPQLANTGLRTLDNKPIEARESPDVYNAVNTVRLIDAVARVLGSFVDPNLIRTLVINLTSENTVAGYAAQIQGYDWLSREGAQFVPEVEHPATVRGARIALDGRFNARHGGARLFICGREGT